MLQALATPAAARQSTSERLRPTPVSTLHRVLSGGRRGEIETDIEVANVPQSARLLEVAPLGVRITCDQVRPRFAGSSKNAWRCC